MTSVSLEYEILPKIQRKPRAYKNTIFDFKPNFETANSSTSPYFWTWQFSNDFRITPPTLSRDKLKSVYLSGKIMLCALLYDFIPISQFQYI